MSKICCTIIFIGNFTLPKLLHILCFFCFSSFWSFFPLCSKLNESVDSKPVTAKEKLSSYTAGEDITCFVSKVSFEDRDGWLYIILQVLPQTWSDCTFKKSKNNFKGKRKPKSKLGIYVLFLFSSMSSCFSRQFNSDRKSLEVTTDPSVSGTVELLAMTTDPKVSLCLCKCIGKANVICKRSIILHFVLIWGYRPPRETVQAGPSSPCQSGRSELPSSSLCAVTHR